jgi:hypothetical protein
VHIGYSACAPTANIPILLAYFTAGISGTALVSVLIHCIKQFTNPELILC